MAENLIIKIQLVDYTRSWDSLYIEDIYHVIEDILHLKPSKDIEVIQKGVGHAPKSYNVGILNEEVWYNNDIELFLEEKFTLHTQGEKTVLIQKAYERYEDVTIKNALPHWSKDYVERIVGYYGTVISMNKETLRYSTKRESLKKDYSGIWNGNWRVRMKVKIPIPSTISVSDVKIEFHYRNQKQTCWRCGMDHQRSECSTKYSGFVNRFNYEQFPPLKRTQNEPAEKHTEENNGETNNGEKEAETQPEDHNGENHTGENQSMEHTGEKPEKHTGEESNNEDDMEAIRPATPEQTVPLVQGNTDPNIQTLEQICLSNDFSNKETLSQEQVSDTMTLVVDVEHSFASQNVRGALDSPMHIDETEVTATASEGEAVETHETADSVMTSGITPGQKKTEHVEMVSESQTASVAEATMEVMESQPSEPMEGLLLSQLEQMHETGALADQSDGFWTIVDGKRKVRGNSTDEDSDSIVKASFGSFTNSIISSGSSTQKKFKETLSEEKDEL